MGIKMYDVVEHTADLKIRVYGSDFPNLLKNAVYAMFDLLTHNLGSNKNKKFYTIRESGDKEDILVNTMNGVLTIFYTEKLIPQHIYVFEQGGFTDSIFNMVCFNGIVEHDIKAITYSDLKITKKNNGLETEIVFDV